jgi:hypothetical protein
MIAITRSMPASARIVKLQLKQQQQQVMLEPQNSPIETPTAGISLPANCPTMLSYLPPAAMLPTCSRA